MLDKAIALAAEGFYVFPLVAGGKLPLIPRWQLRATRNAETLRSWWTDPYGNAVLANIGIATGKFGDKATPLIVVDVDNKNDKNGSDVLETLSMAGYEFDQSFCVDTPTGGHHFYLRANRAYRNGVNVLGLGIDIRGHGGYVCGPGSVTKDGEYVRRV